MSGLDSERLSLVFQARPDILSGIKRAADSPDRVALFNDIATFFYDQMRNSDEPSSKRRRTETPSVAGAANGSSSATAAVITEPVQLEIKEISLSIPVRKKLDLCFTASGIYGRASGSTEPVPGSVFQWKDFEFAFYLPVPEKTQIQHNYILLPRGSSFAPKGTTAPDPLVFTVNAGAIKPGTITGPKAASAQSLASDYHTLFDWAFATFLRGAGSTVQIIASNPARFHSVVKQSHRPSEKAVHIKAFRGSKEGYLFFLATGILWGFKKPLLFIPLERIVAVSYTSVLQRTFNMVVEVFGDEAGDGNAEATEEIEFSMIDQQDYQGIDERYVKKNGLQDRSMAEQRKAKLQLAENIRAAKAEADAGENEDVEMDEVAEDKGGPDVKNMTVLEKAEWEEEKRLQDEEDEEEEDYDPGSEDDSDGSGSSSEEESGAEDEGEGGDDDEEEEEEEEEGEEENVEEEEKPQSPAKTPATRVGGWAALNK